MKTTFLAPIRSVAPLGADPRNAKRLLAGAVGTCLLSLHFLAMAFPQIDSGLRAVAMLGGFVGFVLLALALDRLGRELNFRLARVTAGWYIGSFVMGLVLAGINRAQVDPLVILPIVTGVGIAGRLLIAATVLRLRGAYRAFAIAFALLQCLLAVADVLCVSFHPAGTSLAELEPATKVIVVVDTIANVAFAWLLYELSRVARKVWPPVLPTKPLTAN